MSGHDEQRRRAMDQLAAAFAGAGETKYQSKIQALLRGELPSKGSEHRDESWRKKAKKQRRSLARMISTANRENV